MPFDRFTIEQLAGDILPNRSLEQQIASGFHRCNITTSEGGAIDEEYRVLYTRDRTETTSQVWLGLTAGCAVCHDHKFDPISQREFYELAAFFNNTTQSGMDGNIKDTPPVQFVPRPDDRARYDQLVAPKFRRERDELDARRQAGQARLRSSGWPEAQFDRRGCPADSERRAQASIGVERGDGRHGEYDARWPTHGPADRDRPGVAWEAGHVAAQSFRESAGGRPLEVASAGDFEKDQPFSTAAAWVKLTQDAQSGAIVARMNDQLDHRGWDLGVENGLVNAHFINTWPDDAILKVVTTTPRRCKVGEWNHLLMLATTGRARPGQFEDLFQRTREAAGEGGSRQQTERDDPHRSAVENRAAAQCVAVERCSAARLAGLWPGRLGDAEVVTIGQGHSRRLPGDQTGRRA